MKLSMHQVRSRLMSIAMLISLKKKWRARAKIPRCIWWRKK